MSLYIYYITLKKRHFSNIFFCGLNCFIIKLIIRIPAFCNYFLAQRHKNNVTVNAHSKDKQSESDQLKVLKFLPTNAQRHAPNNQSSTRIQNHSGGCRHFLSDRNPSKFENSNKNLKNLLLEIEAARLLFEITYHSTTKSRG